ncbi:MAG: site-2 protease family protein [Phycisphaerales bacterium]
MGWWITDLLNDPNINGRVWVVSWIVWVIGSICLHELAHGWTAIKLGDDTPIATGHMTWNPMVHMGMHSLLIFIFIGIAWGMMPINPSRLRGRYAESVVSVAGPLMNLALAVLSLVSLILWVPLAQGQLIGSVTISHPLSENMRTFLHLGAMLNIVLMLFNLLPIPPLDGGRIAMDIFPRYRLAMESESARWMVLGLFVLLFVFGGSLMFIFASLSVEGISDAAWSLFFPNLDR